MVRHDKIGAAGRHGETGACTSQRQWEKMLMSLRQMIASIHLVVKSLQCFQDCWMLLLRVLHLLYDMAVLMHLLCVMLAVMQCYILSHLALLCGSLLTV